MVYIEAPRGGREGPGRKLLQLAKFADLRRATDSSLPAGRLPARVLPAHPGSAGALGACSL